MLHLTFIYLKPILSNYLFLLHSLTIYLSSLAFLLHVHANPSVRDKNARNRWRKWVRVKVNKFHVYLCRQNFIPKGIKHCINKNE